MTLELVRVLMFEVVNVTPGIWLVKCVVTSSVA